MVNKKVQRIKLIVAIAVVAIVAILVCIRVLIYQKEGEKNMPFAISKIIIISTAQKDESSVSGEQTTSWNFNVIQNNDLYISIDQKEEHNKKKDIIKNITIENIEIIEAPKVGSLKAYMPNSLEGSRYKYSDEYTVAQSLTYRGADENNYQNLNINKNGGNIGISFANKEVGTYTSEDATEVTYNGTMLAKLNLKDEDVKSKVAFNIIIELNDDKKYSGRIEVDLNCNGLVETGTAKTEITDFSNVVFKRI